MNFYQMSAAEALQRLNAQPAGLKESEAVERLSEHGRNQLNAQKNKSIVQVFFEQFADFLVLILIAAAVISILTDNSESAIVILCVITLNAVLGTIQHFKAQKSLDALQAMSAPEAKVMRGGIVRMIPAAEIVPGDIVCIEAGDIVPADGRLIDCATLLANESALTGEAHSVLKNHLGIPEANAALGDRYNMLYSGSTVQSGRGIMLVCATGMNTEMGKIAALMNAAQRQKTPLQVSLDRFGKRLAAVILIICVLIMALSIFVQGNNLLDAMMFAVALAVAAIPEALSSIITIALAIGTQKMARQNAIIKDLKAVEGLGCVSVICSDKTGTLTMNRMTVREVFTLQDKDLPLLELAMALCNDSSFSEEITLGDPTETALAEYLGREKYNSLRHSFPREQELPFDSNRKLMSTRHSIKGEELLYTKGAIDMLLPKIEFVRTELGLREINAEDIAAINAANLRFSEKGMRVLAFASAPCKHDRLSLEDESGYTLIGLAAMTDPPRAESIAAVAAAKDAGIKPVMITGDHKITAQAIAAEIGIYNEGDICLAGNELDAMSNEELRELLPHISVYARVSPEHKIRIVEAWQARGAIAAMTGDGVNDAPALKKADIGIAMGITGTAVSKDAASVILADDNFATIIKAVESGRSIYDNIKNAVKFLLVGNTAAIITVLITAVFNLPLPFLAVHLLFINLLTDSLPALALSAEPMKNNVLQRKPRPLNESLLNKSAVGYIALHSCMMASAVLTAYFIGLKTDAATAVAMSFATLCLARLLEGFSCRGSESLPRLGLLSNGFSLLAFAAGVLLLAAALFIPFMQRLMVIPALNAASLLTIALCAIAPFLLTQLYRLIRGR